MNQVILMGRLGSDPELKTVGGQQLCKLRIATNDKYRDANGVLQERTQWHHIDVWGKQADSCKTYLKKGQRVLIDGSLEYQKNNTTNVIYTSVKAKRVQFLDRVKADEQQPLKVVRPPEFSNTPDFINDEPEGWDDIPF